MHTNSLIYNQYLKTYDDAGLLVSSYAKRYEAMDKEPIGYMASEYTYDAEGRLATEFYEENIYIGYGGKWNKEYNHSYADMVIETTTGTEEYTVIHLLHDIIGEEIAAYSIRGNVTMMVENGVISQIKAADCTYQFQYK